MIIGFVIGFVVGFVFSMPPLGPTNVLIIERGLKKQFNNAVAIGVGAGFTDMFYILVAYGGVAAITALLPDSVHRVFSENENILKGILAIVGCIFVILYGIKIVKTKSPDVSDSKKKFDEKKFTVKYDKLGNVIKRTGVGIDKIFHTKALEEKDSEIMTSFFIGIGSCLTSVTLPASWFAIVGYLKSSGIIETNFLTGLFLAIGVLAGTSVWFYLMTRLIMKHSDKIREKLPKLNFSIGIFLIILGAGLLIKVVTTFF